MKQICITLLLKNEDSHHLPGSYSIILPESGSVNNKKYLDLDPYQMIGSVVVCNTSLASALAKHCFIHLGKFIYVVVLEDEVLFG